MKTLTKLFLMIALLGTIAMADDGEMGNGGYQGCTVNCPPPPCTVDCPPPAAVLGDDLEINSLDGISEDVTLELIKDYFVLSF